ncbi:hypothetical protein [Streptomyces sp. wa1063]|uniref:hypothetical protein n=1 Tax=Streptomyces sp. wa1063 TaxID=1828212 RepID=UPI000BEFAE49|nr:hypothetical protein [Streptomyces sp. wa1063]
MSASQDDALAAAVAEHGPFPMPVGTGPASMRPEQRTAIAVQIGNVQPATDALIGSFAESVANVRNHEHPAWEDLYCMNLTSYMGERMAPVLKRLLDTETENARLWARVAELETQAEKVTAFCAQRAEYVTSILNCHPDNAHDYYRWQGHAESRRQLSQSLGLPVAWPAEDKQSTPPAPVEDPHDSPLHQSYALGRDLPTGGAK